MSLLELLSIKLGKRLAKLLLQKFFGDWSSAGDDFADLIGAKVENYVDQRDLTRQFESIGERITEKLLPFFERAPGSQGISIEAIVAELAEAFNGRMTAKFFVQEDLDPTRLADAIRRLHPLKPGNFSEEEEILYDRALEETARYLVEIAPQIPDFKISAVSVSLRRLSEIREFVEETAERVRRIEEWTDVHPEEASLQKYEVNYRLNVIRRLDYLELFGADLVFSESRRQTLSVAYVSLNVQVSGSTTEPISYPVEAVLDTLRPKEGRLLIRGEAGSGKSTLFRWIAIEAARGLPVSPRGLARARLWELEQTSKELAERFQFNWRGDIPLLIHLRDCEGGKLPSPRDLPGSIAKWIGSPPEEWVLSILETGRALLLFDGVDELANLHRETVRREIADIVSTYPLNYYILSTRPLAVPEDWLASLGFREARINPMSEVDRAHFVDKWHEAVEHELRQRNLSDPELPRLAAELKEQLPKSPIGRLATYPLLCAMVCALHRERSRKLPESQSELCEALCHMLLHRREMESGLKLRDFPEPYRRLSYEQKRAIVQEIAQFMVLNGESWIPIESARERVTEALRSLADQRPEDASVILEGLIERSGMLREVRPGQIDFIHNTFKEFLAGEHFADASNAGLLAKNMWDPAWRRVIQFAMPTRRRLFASDVIGRMLTALTSSEQGDVSEEARRNGMLLLLQCRSAALHVEPELDRRLDGLAASLFPPRNMTDAEALAVAGNAGIRYLRYRIDLSANEAAACVRALRLISTNDSRKALEGFLEDRRLPVVSELAQAMNPLLIKAVRESLAHGEALPEGIALQIHDLSPLEKETHLWALDLSGTRARDLTPLRALRDLRVLNLTAVPVEDLEPVADLLNLEILVLAQTEISDCYSLSGLQRLRSLDLSSTRIQDITPIQKLPELRSINLEGTPLFERLRTQEHRILGQPKVPVATLLAGLTCNPMPRSWSSLGSVVLWGLKTFEDATPVCLQVAAHPKVKTDEETWKELLVGAGEAFGDRDDMLLVHWGSSVPLQLRSYRERYGDFQGIAERMERSLVDLLPIVQSTVWLPMPLLTLELVAGYVGFTRRQHLDPELEASRYLTALASGDLSLAGRSLGLLREADEERLDAAELIYLWLKEGLVRRSVFLHKVNRDRSETSSPEQGRKRRGQPKRTRKKAMTSTS